MAKHGGMKQAVAPGLVGGRRTDAWQCDGARKLEQHPESHREPMRDFTWRLSSLCVLEKSVASRLEWVRHEAGNQVKAVTRKWRC